jgi:hypothetical protein
MQAVVDASKAVLQARGRQAGPEEEEAIWAGWGQAGADEEEEISFEPVYATRTAIRPAPTEEYAAAAAAAVPSRCWHHSRLYSWLAEFQSASCQRAWPRQWCTTCSRLTTTLGEEAST